MIKIVIEDESTIIGIKDKDSWTIDDCVSLFDSLIIKMYDKDEIKLEIVDKLPLTKINYNAMDEGM